LIVDSHSKEPKEGDIIIVTVDDEIMVKRFHREGDQIILLSENVNHPPIKLTEGSIFVNGIVKNSIRRNLSKTH
jgi:SOS-response transcriptional repressor LexA